jgi:hypothetical protein
MILLHSIHADVVRIRIVGVCHVLGSRGVRAGEVIVLGNARRLRMCHGRTHNGHPPDAGNGGPDSGHLFNLGEPDHSYHLRVTCSRATDEVCLGLSLSATADWDPSRRGPCRRVPSFPQAPCHRDPCHRDPSRREPSRRVPSCRPVPSGN